MTMRFITLVRAATWRAGSPSMVVVRSRLAQMRASSLSISAMLCARDEKRRTGSPTLSGVSTAIAAT